MIGDPTFHLLQQRSGWRTPLGRGWSRQIALGSTLCLVADPQGPLALTSPDGSLGRLTLPRGVALDERGRLYVLGADARLRRTVNDCANPSAPLSVVEMPTLGADAVGERFFSEDAALAILDQLLYVADRSSGRVLVFDLTNLLLLDVWQFSPGIALDVYVKGEKAYILAGSTVYLHDTITLQLLFSDPSQPWKRLLVDAQGRIYLYYSTDADGWLSVFASRASRRDPQVRLYEVTETYDDANAVRDRFPGAPVTQEQDVAGRTTLVFPGGILTRDGVIVQPDPLEPPSASQRLYRRAGVYIVALDSALPNCAWDRIELEMDSLPPGTRVTLASHTADDPEGAVNEAAGYVDVTDYWDAGFTLTAPVQTETRAAPIEETGLINSREGRALVLRIEITGDGYDTPRIRAFRVHFPRVSYLKYLPAVFSSDSESRHFLERTLAVFQIAWDDLEREIRNIPRYYDPKSVPEGDAMEFLASWLDQPLPPEWTGEQKRQVLEALPKILGQRGQVAGLCSLLRAYLAGMSGMENDLLDHYPVLIEGFRERQHAHLNGVEDQPMWGADYARRLQLDVFATEGQVELVSYGDAERDLFDSYAHFFRVFIPAALAREPRDEVLLRQIMDAEKPAHTRYELHLVPARFRVGIQALLGIDTIVGAVPTSTTLDAGSQLGYDSVLGSETTRR